MRLTNSLFGTSPIVAHCPGPLSEGWHAFAYSALNATVEARPARENVLVLTWHGPDRPAKPNGLLERCVARFGVEAQALVHSGSDWNFLRKIEMTAEAIARSDAEYVIGLDSGDVLIVDRPDEIVARFRDRFDCELLYNATGSACWPEEPEFVLFESSLPGAQESQGRCWLNCGAFVGRVEYCRTYFERLLRLARRRSIDDDQIATKALWPEVYPQVQVDYRCEIFQWFNEDRRLFGVRREWPDRQRQLIQWLGPIDPRYGVEVGVGDGYTSDALLQTFPGLRLWMVDPWLEIPGLLDAAYAEKLRAAALWWTSFAADRRHELRTPSTAAAPRFPDESLDFAFIDGDHSFDAVRADLRAWWPKVRPGGLFSGHDYGVYGDAEGVWGVQRAVDEFAAELGRGVEVGQDGVWRIAR